MSNEVRSEKTKGSQCPLCEAESHAHVFDDFGYDGKTYSLVRCLECHFVFLDPQPSDSELNAIYAEYYGVGEETERHLNFRRPVFEDLCFRLEGLKKPDARLLDVGCGNGDFLMMANRHGWNVSGIEISPQAAAFARDERELDVRTGSFENLPFADGTFDAVSILDVLEHIRSPRSTLNSIFKILKPGGVLVIRVPNTPFQILKARIQKLRHGKNFTTLATPLHLNHFDNYTLRRLVEDAGFEIEAVEPGEADGIGSALFLKRSYVFLSKLFVPAGLQLGNILMLSARKK